MSFPFLHALQVLHATQVDVCHVLGGLILVLDAGLLTLVLVYWKETEPPGRPAPRDGRSARDKTR